MTGRHGYFASWLELVLTVAVSIVMLAGTLVIVEQVFIIQGQQAQNDASDRGRAQLCRLVVGVGLPPDDICLSPRVTRYYDPTSVTKTAAATTAQQDLNVLCALAVKLNVVVPDCKGP